MPTISAPPRPSGTRGLAADGGTQRDLVHPEWQAPARAEPTASSARQRQPWLLWVALLMLGCVLPILWQSAPILAPWVTRHIYSTPIVDPLWNIARLRLYLVFFGTMAVSLCAFRMSRELRFALRHPSATRLPAMLAACALLCSFLTLFIVHFGRLQFGAFDYDVLIDHGWRTYLGQRPYQDFYTSMPPGFIFGIKHAFQVFGPSWDANLFATALLASGSFVWLKSLLRRMQVKAGVALLIAFSVEAAAVLPLCFWWYNNTTMVMAAVFYASCLNLARRDAPALPDELSYAASLGLLLLLKPNIAGLTVGLCVPLLFALRRCRLRLAAWTAAGLLLALGILGLEGVSALQLLSIDRAIAADRGGLNTFGFHLMNRSERLLTFGWIAVLGLPLVVVQAPRLQRHLKQHVYRELCFDLLLLLAPLTAIYGVMTNGEWRDVDSTVLLLAAGVAILSRGEQPLPLRQAFAALLLATCAFDITFGGLRLRVYSIGLHQFFEWNAPLHGQSKGFLRHAQVSDTLLAVEDQVGDVVHQHPGRLFFGPRMLSLYALTRTAPPTGLPVFWQPGTAFPTRDTQLWTEAWRSKPFDTLVFLRDDFTYYTPELMAAIAQNYRRDDTFPALTVFYRR